MVPRNPVQFAREYPIGTVVRQAQAAARHARQIVPTLPFHLLSIAALVIIASCTSVDKLQRQYEAGDTAKLDKLIEIAGRPDYPYGTRKSAVTALGKIGDSKAVPILIKTLQQYERRYTLQQSAIVALGEIGDLSAVESIGHLLDRSVMDPAKAELRLAAWPVLGELGGDEAAEILVNALAFFDKMMLLEEQRAGRGVFSGDEESWRSWQDSLRVPRGLRSSGGSGGLFPQDDYPAVSMFGTPMGQLERHVEDPTPEEREAVHAALVMVGPDAIPVILDYLNSKETTVTLKAELGTIVDEIKKALTNAPDG